MAGTLVAYSYVQKAMRDKGIRVKPEDIGTGVFKIPNPADGPLAHTTVLVPKITLADARLRALRCEEATWIPEAVVTYEEIQNSDRACGDNCSATSECTGGLSPCWWCDPFDGCVR